MYEIASYLVAFAAVVWARHATLSPPLVVGRERCVTCPNNGCEGDYIVLTVTLFFYWVTFQFYLQERELKRKKKWNKQTNKQNCRRKTWDGLTILFPAVWFPPPQECPQEIFYINKVEKKVPPNPISMIKVCARALRPGIRRRARQGDERGEVVRKGSSSSFFYYYFIILLCL